MATKHSFDDSSTIDRGRTAMRRYSCSRPIALALAEGVIRREITVLDYGCGHGADIRFLVSRGIKASGWDPIHRPRTKLAARNIVNLGYVLNVIEDPAERREALLKAFSLAKDALIVAVRVDNALDGAETFADGVRTNAATFQKIFSQTEFREYVEQTLGKRTHVASVGICYVFASDEAEARFLANRAFTRRLEYRVDLIDEFAKSPTAKRFVALAGKLGRIPLPQEFPAFARLEERFGSADRIARLTLRQVDRAAFEGSQHQRREDILTYFAILRLQGVKAPPLNALPSSVREDIKTLWSRASDALAEADRFLFRLGDREQVRAACSSARVGKLLPEDLYVHRSAEDELPPLLRVLLFAARSLVGEFEYDLAKIALDGRAVSFLYYPDFDTDPHPVLARSVRVYLPKASYSVRSYVTSENPPILHRKETFVGRDYPHYARFAELTAEEERLGLLSSPTIGSRLGWLALLSERGLLVEDHHVRDRKAAALPPGE